MTEPGLGEDASWGAVEGLSDFWALRTRTASGNVMEFEAFEIGYDPKLYFENSRTEHGGPTYDISEAEPSVEGWIRWDGCSHLTVGHDNAPWHHDRFQELDRLHDVLKHIRTIAADRIEGWCPE